MFFKFKIIRNVLVSSFCFIWISMLWVYGRYKYFYTYSAGFDFRRQNLTSKVDPRAVMVKSLAITYYSDTWQAATSVGDPDEPEHYLLSNRVYCRVVYDLGYVRYQWVLLPIAKAKSRNCFPLHVLSVAPLDKKSNGKTLQIRKCWTMMTVNFLVHGKQRKKSELRK